jgi:putative transcriptional regulator
MALRCSGSLTIAVVVLCGSLTLPAQSTRVQDLGIGKLLVARRGSLDPVFAETVILLVHYDHDGTVGLAINRRTDVPIARALPAGAFKGTKGRSDPVYMGGPVEVQNVLALLRAGTMPEGATHVSGKVYLVSSKLLLEKTLAERAEPGEFRVYLGYCGWGPGQLENETVHGFWHIFASDADLVFDSKPDTLWSRLIAHVGQRIARERVPTIGVAKPTYRSLDSPVLYK